MAYIIDERPETMYAGLSEEAKERWRQQEIAEHGRVVSEEDKRKKKRKKKLKRFRREQKKRRE